MRTFAAITAGGVLSVLLLKLLVAFFLPLLGALIGLFLTVVKFALLAAVGYFVYSLIFKRRKEADQAT